MLVCSFGHFEPNFLISCMYVIPFCDAKTWERSVQGYTRDYYIVPTISGRNIETQLPNAYLAGNIAKEYGDGKPYQCPKIFDLTLFPSKHRPH